MDDWTVLLRIPAEGFRMEGVQADFWTWSDDGKTLDFYAAQPGRDTVDLLITWLQKEEKKELSREQVMAELPTLLKSFGDFRAASFERSSVIGHFRGRSSVVYVNPEKSKGFLT